MRRHDMRYITRDEKDLHGWRVQIIRNSNGTPVSVTRCFSDEKYGGKKRSLKAAMLERDHMEIAMGRPRKNQYL